MILNLNKNFEGFVPFKLLNNKTSYREVYLSKNADKELVNLVVYKKSMLPKNFNGNVTEFNVSHNLKSEVFPEYLNRGTVEHRGDEIVWIAYRSVTGMPLREWVNRRRSIDLDLILNMFRNLILALMEVSVLTGRGGFNNISPDNIQVVRDNKRYGKLKIVDLSCVSMNTGGKHFFKSSYLNPFYCSPETFRGECNEKTDIFSLGVLLTFMIQKETPWGEDWDYEGMTPSNIRCIRRRGANLMLAEPVLSIVKKAIAPSPSKRYSDYSKFIEDIERYLSTPDNPFEYGKLVYELHSKVMDNLSKMVDLEEKEEVKKSEPKTKKRLGGGFNDVAGMDELKRLLKRNFIDIVKNKSLSERYKIMPPNSIILWGPPGVGKTFISQKLAEESGLNFKLVKPSDLGSVYIHGTQGKIAELFETSEELAKKTKKGVLLVLDEFDVMVPQRDNSIGSTNQAGEVAEFLTRLNDCAEKGIYVVATTNRLDAIDSAAMRTGRNGAIVYVGLPDEESRFKLFALELKDRPYSDVDIKRLAKLTSGFSPSDISHVVVETARSAFEKALAQGGKKVVLITQEMLEYQISQTRPSVSKEELNKYEQAHTTYSNYSAKERSKIGFKYY